MSVERLFPGEWNATGSKPPVLLSPLGEFTLGFDPVDTFEHLEFCNSRGDRLLVWRDPATHVELVIRSTEPELPEGMRVDGCVAAIWRARSTEGKLRDYTFRCEVLEQSTLYQGSCSGEFLESKEWSDGSMTLALGTQDADAITRVPGTLFPPRWLNDDWATAEVHNIDLVRSTEQGFQIRPPVLHRAKQCRSSSYSHGRPNRTTTPAQPAGSPSIRRPRNCCVSRPASNWDDRSASTSRWLPAYS